MKCALLGLKVVKSASLGQLADWEDEGETGDPSHAEVDALCSAWRSIPAYREQGATRGGGGATHCRHCGECL